jgi:hypothetical protein
MHDMTLDMFLSPGTILSNKYSSIQLTTFPALTTAYCVADLPSYHVASRSRAIETSQVRRRSMLVHVHPGPMWPRHILLSDTAVHPGPWSDAIQLSDSADEQLLPLATAVGLLNLQSPGGRHTILYQSAVSRT